MFCPKCATEINDGSNFCTKCGAGTLAPRTEGNGPRKGAGTVVIVSAVAIVFGLMLVFSARDKSEQQRITEQSQLNQSVAPATKESSRQPVSEPQEAYGSQTTEAAPADSGDVLYPFDFLQNPFKDKGRMVTLYVLPFPILREGTLVEYQALNPRAAALAGIKGLRFNRMISENVALFDIMALEAGESRDPQMKGQLAVLVKNGDRPPDDTRPWDVEPLGTVEGTNGFGAPIQVPAVRFWSYSQLNPAGGNPQEPTEPTGESLGAVNLVRQRVQPTDALLALHPDIQNAEWSAVSNQQICGNGCWHVEAKVPIHKEGADPAQNFENAGWQVNIDQHTVKPDAAAMKYFSISGTSN